MIARSETQGRTRHLLWDDHTMDGIEIRTTAPGEYRAASATLSTALLHAPMSDDDWAKSFVVPSWEGSDSISAWDGERCVGHASGFRFDTLVPGGAWLPTSGVTRVGVLATHRRRGIMRRLVERLLVEAVQRGQVLASLRASEPLIYQRFGFGLAGRGVEATVVAKQALPLTGVDAGSSMRLLRHDEILATVPSIYAATTPRPGLLDRPMWMWQRYLEKATELGGDAEFVAVHTSADGVDDGYVHYGVKWKEERGTPPRGTGEVYELWASDATVELALWDYLFHVDLVDEWFAEERPVDDLVQHAVADPRAYRTTMVWDEQWLRLLDVDATLGARRYAEAAGSVSIGVSDTLLAGNRGGWHVSASGAKHLDDDREVDLTMDVSVLAAAYLGGTSFTALAAAGRIDVHDPGALATADALFVSPVAPFCCSGF